MEQLPENDAPQTPSEHQPSETEAFSPAAEEQAVPLKSEPLMEPSPEAGAGASRESEAPTLEEIPSVEQPVSSAQPERSEDAAALQGEGTEAEALEVAEQPSAGMQEPAAKTEEVPPSGETGASAAPSGEVEAPMAPGAKAEKPEAKKPQATPGRPEKPAGPRLAGLRPGMVVEGTVTRVEKYGAFVNLGLVERRDGLIHISELATYRIRRVEDVVQVGSPVRARVVSVDMGRGRIALSLNDVDDGTASEASAGPSEPALTAIALAFQQAQSRREEQERSESRGGEVGSRKKREQEELMRKFRN